MEEFQTVVLDMDELQSHEEQHAYASFGIFIESSFRSEQETWCFSVEKCSNNKTIRLKTWFKNTADCIDKK